MPRRFAFFELHPCPFRPFQDGFFGIFVRFDDRHLRREIERREHVANGTRSHRDAECSQNEIGDDFGCPPFDGVPGGDGALEDDFLELLFLYVIEFRMPSGAFFPRETGEIVVVLLEFSLPPFDGGVGCLNDVDDVVVVKSFEDQLSTLKPCEGLGR